MRSFPSIYPDALEASVGYRRLNFSDAVNVFTGSLGKYYRDFLFGTRLNQVAGGARGTSVSFSARRYSGSEGAYIGAELAGGSVREDLRTVADVAATRNRSIGAEALFIVQSRWMLMGNADIGRDELPGRQSANYLSGSVGVGVRF